MAIQSISVNGDVQQIDYNGLVNKPTIPDITGLTDRVTALESNSGSSGSALPSVTSSDQGKVLEVDAYGEWELSSICDDLSAICEALRSEINSLKTRVYTLEHSDGSTASSISGEKLSLIGTNAVVNGEKLSVTGSGFTVNGEKLSIIEEV